MGEPGFFQHLAGSDQTGCVETELGVLAAAGRPFARAFGMEAHPNSDQWLDAHFFCRTNSLLKLLEFLRNNDDRFIKLATEERNPNKSRILVAVANDQTLRVLMHGKRCNQFRFTARFETKMELLARVDDFFDHFAQLIHLDRENAAILIVITELRHGALKRAVNRFEAVPQQILKPDQQRKPEASRARFIHYFQDVDGAAVLLQRL